MELFPNSDSPIWKSMDTNLNKKDNTKSIDKEYTNNENDLDSKSEKIKTESGIETNIKDAVPEKTNPEEVSVLEKNNAITSIPKEKKTLPLDKDNKNQLDIIEKNTVYYIQLASLSEEILVVKEWKRLKKIYSPQLDKLTYITEKVNVLGLLLLPHRNRILRFL